MLPCPLAQTKEPRMSDRVRYRLQASNDVPYFLVGAMRSGTTLLRLMLDHHPQVAFQSEFEFVVDLMGDDGHVPDLDTYLDWLSIHRIFLSARLEIDHSLRYAELVKSFLDQGRNRAHKVLVGATVHHHFDRLLHIWPNARFIHLVRDPRDVANSVMAMGWAGNAWMGAKQWVEVELLWDRMTTMLARDRWHDVRYESLVADAASTLTGICRFMNIPYDHDMLSYPSHTTYKAPNRSSAYQWKHRMPTTQVRLAEARVGDMLKSRDYESSTLPTLRVGPLRHFSIRLQDWVYRLAFRSRRYGVGLVLATAISRRLGWKAWYHRCRCHANAITASHVK